MAACITKRLEGLDLELTTIRNMFLFLYVELSLNISYILKSFSSIVFNHRRKQFFCKSRDEKKS
jgi:hypothetical protein